MILRRPAPLRSMCSRSLNVVRSSRRATPERARAVCAAFMVALALLAPAAALGDSLFDGFLDPSDGAFDASHWLLNKRGFLPVPIIVTEPALGYGGGASLLFFHRSKQDRVRAEENPDELLGLPPSISFVMGFGTEKSSWGTGGGHFGTWRDDTIRYLGAIAYTSLNLDFYVADHPIAYNLEGGLISQELQLRLFGSNFFLGGRYRYTRFDMAFRFERGPIAGRELSRDESNSGISVIGRYDSRDNIFTPSRGQDFSVVGTFWSESLGGDRDYQILETQLISYHPFFDEKLVFGVRVGADFSFGKNPVYADPYVDLRGIPALRHHDERAGEAEFELRWRVYKRFSLVGFAGVGWIDGPNSDLKDPGAIPAGGIGLRYLVARLLGLHSGIDLAFSSDTTVFYIQTGGAW